MIKANIAYNDNQIVKMEISGHAEYANSGKDIVCASVSTAIIVTVNAIEKLNVLDGIKYDIEEGYFLVVVNKHSEILDALLDNLMYSLNDLSNQYPKYIKIKKEG